MLGLQAIPDRNRLNLSWLIKLRWAQLAGQTFTILGANTILGVDLPLIVLFSTVAMGAASNLACEMWLRRKSDVAEWQLAAVMAYDVALLTVLLYFTGGPSNPFSFLYLVQIALAAVVLRGQLSWTLVALSLGSFGLLLLGHRDLIVDDVDPAADHQRGMWVALGVASAFIVLFLRRITTALAERERELTEARNLAARQERLASLATMAAGAAHELSTPLGTIALVAKELERHLAGGSPEMIEDARLIREEVGRCRVILDQMAGGAGASAGEEMRAIEVSDLVEQSLTGTRPQPEVDLELDPQVAATVVRLPPRAVAQALRAVITNAQDASPDGRSVVVNASAADGYVRIDVIDRGAGMPPEVFARIGEPFFTTKSPGRGMGLGLFLTRAVLEGIGGGLVIDSKPGGGTTVALTIPVDIEPKPESPPAESKG